MSDIVLVAMISGLVGPTILAVVAFLIARANKREDWRRQDLVASMLVNSSQAVTVQLDGLKAGQKEIHTLVNSDMTAARNAELEQTEVALLALEEIVTLKLATGVQSTEAAHAKIDATKARITELKLILADRAAAQATADEERKE